MWWGCRCGELCRYSHLQAPPLRYLDLSSTQGWLPILVFPLFPPPDPVSPTPATSPLAVLYRKPCFLCGWDSPPTPLSSWQTTPVSPSHWGFTSLELKDSQAKGCGLMVLFPRPFYVPIVEASLLWVKLKWSKQSLTLKELSNSSTVWTNSLWP